MSASDTYLTEGSVIDRLKSLADFCEGIAEDDRETSWCRDVAEQLRKIVKTEIRPLVAEANKSHWKGRSW